MKKIPKKVKILGVEYKVSIVPRIQDIAGGHGLDRIGQNDFLMREIRLFDMGDSVQNWQTFLHEVIHAYSFALGLKLEKLEAPDNEDVNIIDSIASLATEFLVNNKIL
jgi:hypothetical protein